MSDLTVPPPMPPLVRTQTGHIGVDLAKVEERDAIWSERVASLQARLEAAERDAVRLDWMEANPDRIGRSKGYLKSPDAWFWRDANGTHRDAPSLRAAIDAATQE